jgi:hypothetical protein
VPVCLSVFQFRSASVTRACDYDTFASEHLFHAGGTEILAYRIASFATQQKNHVYAYPPFAVLKLRIVIATFKSSPALFIL